MKRSITGHRLGEHHQNAKLSDAQVRTMRAEYERGVTGYATLAKKYGCGVSTARDTCTYRTRYSA